MKRRDHFPRTIHPAGSAALARTGEHCPQTGWWVATTASDGAPRFFLEGSLMPAVAGSAAAWKRVAPAALNGV